MEKDIESSLLLDFYSNLLTEKQKEIMHLYIDCDTSLSEIAVITGSSRQAVYDMIKVSEKSLKDFENKLGCVKKYLENRNELIDCEKLLDDLIFSSHNEKLEKVKAKVQKVLKNQ